MSHVASGGSAYRVDEAFGIVPLWLVEARVSDRAVRLYALLSGLRDYGTDMATVGRKLLAKKLSCSSDSLDRAKAELEKARAISVIRGDRVLGEQFPRNAYLVHRTRAGSRTTAARGVAAPERLGGSRTGAAPYERTTSNENGGVGEKAIKDSFTSVDGKPVTELEAKFATDVLDAFNAAFGKKFSGRDHFVGVVMRIREHPTLDVGDFVEAIEKTKNGRKWWKGNITPRVVFGSSRAFDYARNNDVDQEASDDDLSAYTRV